jgi:hypothetical protein
VSQGSPSLERPPGRGGQRGDEREDVLGRGFETQRLTHGAKIMPDPVLGVSVELSV